MFKNKNLVYLFLGQLISYTGDSIYMIALPWLILDITNSSSTTALVTMSSYLPTLIFGVFLYITDKFNTNKELDSDFTLKSVVIISIFQVFYLKIQ